MELAEKYLTKQFISVIQPLHNVIVNQLRSSFWRFLDGPNP